MGVEFEDNNFNRPDFNASATPKLATWLINKGLAKDVSGANKIQIVASIIFLAIAVYLFVK